MQNVYRTRPCIQRFWKLKTTNYNPILGTNFTKRIFLLSLNMQLKKAFSSKSFVKEGMTEEFCQNFEKFGHYKPSALSLGQLASFGKLHKYKMR